MIQTGNVAGGSKPTDGEFSADIEEMVSANLFAEQEGLGIFNTDPGAVDRAIRPLVWEVEDMDAFFAKVKNTPQRAIIEYIRDGASMKALLLDSWTYINFNLAGIQCPRLNTPQSGLNKVRTLLVRTLSVHRMLSVSRLVGERGSIEAFWPSAVCRRSQILL